MKVLNLTIASFRIREISDKVNRFGSGTHRIFEQLKIPVKDVVIGPNHIGVLLEDGKAFRVAFSINSEKLDLTKSDNKWYVKKLDTHELPLIIVICMKCSFRRSRSNKYSKGSIIVSPDGSF